MLGSFEGTAYRLADNWFSAIPCDTNKPIRYLEIGTFYGANLISVANTYGSHKDSQLYCIDPWTDYDEYNEYKGKQDATYTTFRRNIANNNLEEKVTVLRGFSNNEIPKLQDDFFDIIYVDGNHEPEYVLEDAVLAFRKLKVGGFMVFDDYGWGGPDLTQRGIDGFLNGYHKRIQIVNSNINSQVFIRKMR